MKKLSFVLTLSTAMTLAFSACKKLVSASPSKDAVMSSAIEGLSLEQNKRFSDGSEEFSEIYDEGSGLGPIYVATSCASCHSGDNKGHPSTNLTRFGQIDTNGNQYLDRGAPQLQHFALPGYTGERIPQGAMSSNFMAPIVAGLGYIELVPEQDMIDMADPQDLNGDGISGRVHWNVIPNWVKPSANAIQQNGKYICRFGRKGGVYNLHQQIVGAFNNDMGITTSYMPIDPYNAESGIHPSLSSGADIDDKSLNSTVFYIQALQAPIQRDQNNVVVMEGKTIFKNIGCAKCHVESLRTGNSIISALHQKTFYPYTDLLLHDMGAALNDHYTEGFAMASEWRTTPLWGLGLSKDAQGGVMYLMHDGRAGSFEEAIQWHGGEAEQSKINFNQISKTDQNRLIAFLSSL